MRYIGRIITTMKIEDVSEFIEVTQDASSVVNRSATIPTIIIGYKKVTEIFGETSIINKKLGDNLYWTFTKRERRMDFEDDIKAFYENVEKFIKSHVPYSFFDLLSSSSERKQLLTKVMLGDDKKILYETEKVLYVFLPSVRRVVGISVDELKFLGKTVENLKTGYKIETCVPETFLNEDIFKKNLAMVPFLFYLASF